ncbi:MAG TPA: glycosyltransferase family 1 protein [Bacteroidales bacterium]|nr:glycosyltransferase family 1 protein [Bacteroidales bacterium]HPF03370.1 glycosyltransferase family 1 protein [Bacteroidales bacterium]HPJ58568.1 glycosyltransferase family 1 protein [Bacteroidales bacterium]HPR11273.1 glycosyltransferase family 1 protein [Bacteroidales bacterium]HRW86380.1 glycosyltransferase family 1 protein [Bacteroidales bacterium]
MTNDLHIITLNVPYPPDYGGMIDSFHRIRVLKNLGAGIHLHCFEYGREQSSELISLCKSVSYYKRNMSFGRQFSLKPFIVVSRTSPKLHSNLLNDDHPILFDGLHTTDLLCHPDLSNRIKIVRVHNIEHEYYNSMSRQAGSLIRNIYFNIESARLKRYESVLKNADMILTLSGHDQHYFGTVYGNAELIYPFHQYDVPENKEGSGDYLLWHGDLSVKENSIVAEYLVEKIFPEIPCTCIIAGKQPSGLLIRKAGKHSNIRIIANPSGPVMSELIRDAHINILIALSTHGMKLKLLNSLFAGRHCLVNSNLVFSTGLAKACHVRDSAEDIIRTAKQLMKQPFDAEMKTERSALLEPFSNRFNGIRLMKLIFPV